MAEHKDKAATEQKAAAPKKDSIDPNAYYLVEVNRAIKLGKNGDVILTRTTDNRVRGRMIEQIPAEALVKYTKVR